MNRPQRPARWRARLAEMNPTFGRIVLPDDAQLDQDEEYADVEFDGKLRRFRLHDYSDLYAIRGLYETLIYDRLECCSPSRVVGLLEEVLVDFGADPAALRVVDVGAGNGMAGDELDALGVERIIGVDIVPAAREAALRDRPGVYDEYLIADLANLCEADEKRLRSARLNCLVTVGALGFGDIPPAAFTKALDMVGAGGWLAFNIRDGYLHDQDSSGFAKLVQSLGQRRIIQLQALQRYRHRVSVASEPLYYVAMVARKLRDLPDEIMERWVEQPSGHEKET